MYIDRFILPLLKKALTWSPVVLLRGARQTGKTTLMQHLKGLEYRYISFDNLPSLLAAKDDPVGFIKDLEGPTILDEIQRVPDLFLPIKERVDKEKIPGQFLLTGSADPLLLPHLRDSLAGRMRLLPLYPLSEAEKRGKSGITHFWDHSFTSQVFEPCSKRTGITSWLQGGYPSLLTKKNLSEKNAWLEDYTGLILQKDAVEITRIDHLSDLPRLFSLLAYRVGGLLQIEELGRTLRLSAATAKRYLAILEALFLYQPLPAWSGNLSKRLVKSPKIYLNDVALTSFLLGQTEEKILEDGTVFGKLLENFVFNELQKARSWNEPSSDIFHLRDYRGGEIDFILEKRGGDLIAIEVKGRETVRPDDFKALKAMQEELGKQFVRGYVIYLGEEIIPFGKNLYALPLSSFWS